MSTLSTAVDLGEEMVLDPSELKKLKLTGVNEEELAEALFQRLQGRLPTKLFDKTTEDLLQEGIVLEDGLESVYDQLTLKMAEMLKERVFERLKNWSSAGKEKGVIEKNFSVSEEIQTFQDLDAQLTLSTSLDIQNCEAKTLKRKTTDESTRNVKMRPPAPLPEPVIHVLLIDHVLDTIFENFVFEDKGAANLANFRLVCRLWNQRATEALRKTELEIIFEGNDFELEDSESKLQRYIQTMENSSLIPFRYYSLKLGIFPNLLYVNLMENFLQTFGPDAVALKFHFGTQFSLPLEIYSVNFNLINLERLEICFREPGYGLSYRGGFVINLGVGRLVSNQSGIPQFITKLLTGAPKLKIFGVHEKYGSRKCTPEIFKWVPETVKDMRLNLQKLVPAYFSALAEPKLKLVQLSLGCMDFEFIGGDKDVNDFFRMQGKSLTSLNLNQPSMTIVSKQFPQLESLRSLTLEFCRYRRVNMSIRDTFPNLRVLKLETTSQNLANLILSINSRVVTSVEELHLPSQIYQQQAMELLPKRFPNVKIIFLRLYEKTDQQTLSSVCTHYTEIEELHLFLRKGGGDDFNVNAALCGVSDEICKGLMYNSNFRKIDLKGFQDEPTLLNLTKLKKLAVSAFPNTSAPLTDMSVHHILLKMKSLKELIIPESNKISPCYLDQLKASLDLFYGRPQTIQNNFDDQFNLQFTISQPDSDVSSDVDSIESSDSD